jgi:Transposase protein
MGYATTRSAERVAAAMGALVSAPIQFEAACDIPKGGVLLALPALLAVGLLRHTEQLYTLPAGFYSLASIFLLLALMALARIKSIEQLRYAAPGEWGNLLGLDRIPEVRTLRQKLESLCRDMGRAVRWNTELAKEWIAGQRDSELIFYADGHVRVYSGDLTPLPRHYVARERLCLRGTTDYWINAMDGQPFFFVNKEVDPGLLATLRRDLVPWLELYAPVSPELQRQMEKDPLQHRFTLVFDREAYSPDFFLEMKQRRIAILTYHKYPGENWSAEEFADCRLRLAGGEQVTMKLAERGTMLSNQLWVREVRKLSEGGHQSAILSTNYQADYTTLAVSMFARWSQENFYKYMRQHYSLDRLVEYGTEEIPDAIRVVNPAWRKLDSQIRGQREKLRRQLALFGALDLQGPLSEAEVARYGRQKGELQEQIEKLNQQIDLLKTQRKETPHHISVKDLSEPDRFTRLRTERKHFIDTIKLISYRAETSMASLLRDQLSRVDDARALLRQIYETEVDLIPDLQVQVLIVRLHHLTQAAHDDAVRFLCDELNATKTVFPGTNLTMIFKLGSS